MIVTASAHQPPPFQDDFELRLNGQDRGLINAWLAGLNLRTNNADLAEKALAGELPPLPFKGGLERKIKAQNKVGSLWYVAMWQGLRGEDLRVDTDQSIQLVCSKTQVPVTYTLDTATLFSKAAE
ncbi:hypothetical protein GCM10010975_26760 [Comamonas phosphati]|nr:hypothetical protein GCM10010975_26760 [Comamonas phosphati]